jgi:hypothetical protein
VEVRLEVVAVVRVVVVVVATGTHVYLGKGNVPSLYFSVGSKMV